MFLDDQDFTAHGYQPDVVGTPDCVPYSWNGVDFPQGIRAGTKPWWDDLLHQVVPHIIGGIHPGGPSVAGTWGAENRNNVNNPGWRSFHDGGLALDLNAPWNPNGAGPQDGNTYGVPSVVGPIVRDLGGLWGGDFTGTQDPMHFECHTTLDEIAARYPNGNHTPAPQLPPGGAFPLPHGYYFGPLSGPAQSISGSSSSEGADLSAHRAEISRVQSALNRASHGQVAQLAVDGQYGPHTQGAVAWFQRTHNLSVDGLTGPATWAKLGL